MLPDQSEIPRCARNDIRPQMGPPFSRRTPHTSCPEGLSVSANSRQDVPQKRKAPRQWDQKDVFGQRGPLPGVSSLLLRSFSCLQHHHGCVFLEVHATSIAFAAVVLNVPAGRTDKAERRVAARAELRLCGILMAAFGASHRRTWWTRRDSNPRPQRCERRALPTELRAHAFPYHGPI